MQDATKISLNSLSEFIHVNEVLLIRVKTEMTDLLILSFLVFFRKNSSLCLQILKTFHGNWHCCESYFVALYLYEACLVKSHLAPCSMFLIPFSIVKKELVYMLLAPPFCLFCTCFVYLAHVTLSFFSFSWCLGLAAACNSDAPWTFCSIPDH